MDLTKFTYDDLVDLSSRLLLLLESESFALGLAGACDGISAQHLLDLIEKTSPVKSYREALRSGGHLFAVENVYCDDDNDDNNNDDDLFTGDDHGGVKRRQ